MKRLLVALLIAALLPNPLWAAPSYKSSVIQMEVDGKPWCSAVSIGSRSESMFFLTAAHCYTVGMTIHGHQAEVAAYNRDLDLMLLRTEGYYVPALWFGKEVKKGDRVMWAGYPRETGATYAQYFGKVIKLHLDLSDISHIWTDLNVTEFDEPHGFLNGNSGGAVIKDGKLVGIVVAQFFAEQGDPEKPVVRGGYVSRAAIEKFLGL